MPAYLFAATHHTTRVCCGVEERAGPPPPSAHARDTATGVCALVVHLGPSVLGGELRVEGEALVCKRWARRGEAAAPDIRLTKDVWPWAPEVAPGGAGL
jgi:hypothetical protein